MSDTFRKEYRQLNEDQKNDVQLIKTYAEDLFRKLENAGQNYSIDARAMAIAKTNLEQCVMWAVKAIT